MSKRGFILACIALVLALGFMFFGPTIMEYMVEENPLNLEQPADSAKTDASTALSYQTVYDSVSSFLRRNDDFISTLYLAIEGANTLDYLIEQEHKVYTFNANFFKLMYDVHDDSLDIAIHDAREDHIVNHLNLPIQDLRRRADSIDAIYNSDSFLANLSDSINIIIEQGYILSNALAVRDSSFKELPFKLFIHTDSTKSDTLPVISIAAFWDTTKTEYPFNKYVAHLQFKN